MVTVPSSTGTTGSDGLGPPEPPLACVLHPTRRVGADSSTPLSFKTRARNQILRLHRELLDEREKHEQVVKQLREQNKEDVLSLSSRVGVFEAQWSRLQRRMSELWLEVEGLKIAEHTYPALNTSAQMAYGSITNTSTQTQETSSSNAATQADEDTPSILKLRLAASNEVELKRWRTAFGHLSGTPEQMALSSKATDKELRDWRTAFKQIQGTPAQKAASSKEAIDEVKEWRTSFKHTLDTPAQAAAKSEEAINELREWHTSFNHVSGTPAKRAEASKTFLRKFSLEQWKNFELLRSENAHRQQNQTLKSEIQQLQERNLNLSTELEREMSKREKLLRAFDEYQGTLNPQNETRELTSATGLSSSHGGLDIGNDPRSPKSAQLQKRKREVSEPDRQQDEPLPASQRRRMEYSNPEWNLYGRQRTSVAQMATPQNVFGDQHPAESSTMRSILPAGMAMGSSRESISSIPTAPRSMSVQCSTMYPMEPSRVPEGTRRNSESIGTFASGRVLDTRRPSIASAADSPCVNESMPKQFLPVEKKWKHSMLKKEH